MLSVIPDYVKGSVLTGILCYVLSVAVPTVFYGLQFWLFGLFRMRENAKCSLIHNALIMACLWVLAEWIRSYLFSALPWLSYSMGITLGRSKYLIQPAEFGGAQILSFAVVLTSFFVGYAFRTKQWKLLFVPLALFLLQFGVGALLYSLAVNRISTARRPEFSAALIQPALTPETVWNEEHANELVRKLFSLNENAALKKPGLIVWTETTVPWTYASDDDFLKELLSVTKPAGSYTLLGMNSALDRSGEAISNSVHLLDPAGKHLAQYDKQDLLALVEKPLFEEDGTIILPFLANSGVSMHSGQNVLPVSTPWGKAGVLLCNEATSSPQAHEHAKQGASFLVNMGNDSWFSDGYIPLQHFYNCRLRAVETRKDVLVNNNMGYSGLIRADGEIAAFYDASVTGVRVVRVQPNDLPAANTFIFVTIAFGLTILSAIYQAFRRKQQSHQNNFLT